MSHRPAEKINNGEGKFLLTAKNKYGVGGGLDFAESGDGMSLTKGMIESRGEKKGRVFTLYTLFVTSVSV